MKWSLNIGCISDPCTCFSKAFTDPAHLVTTTGMLALHHYVGIRSWVTYAALPWTSEHIISLGGRNWNNNGGWDHLPPRLSLPRSSISVICNNPSKWRLFWVRILDRSARGIICTTRWYFWGQYIYDMDNFNGKEWSWWWTTQVPARPRLDPSCRRRYACCCSCSCTRLRWWVGQLLFGGYFLHFTDIHVVARGTVRLCIRTWDKVLNAVSLVLV